MCTAPIAGALDRLQGEVGYGFLLPTLISIRNDLQNLEEKDFVYCKPLLEVLLDSLQTR